ncbi:MAG TPA: MFS transporter [Aggregatilineales bacterium]|nr:MFS transporter [Aggregatilineales bacterium]
MLQRTHVADNAIPPRTSLYAALGGTFFLRLGGGVMGILTGLFLAAKNSELGADHPFYISASLAGIIIASFFVTELAGSFVSGTLIDRYGPRRYMVLGPLFGAAAMGVTMMLHLDYNSSGFQFIVFLILMLCARLLEGAAAASANPASLAYIAAYTTNNPKLRSRISGLFELVTLIGGIVGFVIGGRLWDKFGQTAFLLNAGFYLVSVVIFLSVPSVKRVEKHEKAESHDLKAYLKLVSSPRLRELIPAWLAISGLLGVLFNHATFQLSSAKPVGLSEAEGREIIHFAGQSLSHAFSGSQVGIVFGVYAVAFGVGILVWTLIIPRMRKSTAMLISGFGVIAASIMIYLLNHSPITVTAHSIEITNPVTWLLIVLMVISVMVESGFTPAALTYLSDISELHKENRGMVMGLYSFLLGAGQLGGTILAGPFADWQGIDGLLLFMVILAIISIFSVSLLRGDEVRTHEELTAVSENGVRVAGK